ncbi:TonB-dependent receptor [Prosthecobacter sp.]|uniref:TonB-dependent receptor plug domain-containing protein n=1 Tax=Prosthecobacter sp. TaxID=1965333 RepID=UPI001DAAAB60|nr:TonB-dependent receptor [Prosthecobacter sp.]MCB1278245.1 TonB-dependent receptor [Prosthecobacter sp.]
MRRLSLPVFIAVSTTGFTAEVVEAKKGGVKKAVEVPEVVITATRSETPVSQVPAAVKTLDRRQMEERLVRTFPEALRETPGVAIQKTSNGQGSPFIRGFTGFRNLMMIDGIRFNNSTFRDGPNQYWNTLDSYALNRVEVLPSQGSVLYGSDAVGGTVNAFTKDSGLLSEAEGGFFSHGRADYRYSTAEHSNVEHLETSIGEGQKWGLHAGVTLSQFGDVTDGSGRRQRHTGYDQWAFDVRLDVALDEQWTFTAAHQQVRQNDVWRTHSTNSGVSFAGTVIGTDRVRLFDQERTLSYARLAGKDLNSFIDNASLTLSLQTASEDQFRITGGGVQSSNKVDVTTIGADLQFESDSPIGNLVYGVDFYEDFVQSNASNNPFQGAVADNSTYSLLGVHIQDEIEFCDRVHLFIGERYTHATARLGSFRDPFTLAQRSFANSWNNFSGSARFVIDLDEDDRFSLYGGVSQAFRAPNLSDLSRFDVALSGRTETPAPGLSPEKYLTYEIGLKAVTETITASMGYFYTRLNNLIIRRSTAVPLQDTKTNGGDGYMQGFEFAARWQIDRHWSIFGHLAWVEGESDQFIGTTTQKRREPLGKISPLVGYGGVRWQTTDHRFWTEFVCLTYGEAGRLNTSDQLDTQRIPPNGTPSFWLLTLRGGYAINENLILTASLDNLLNQTYRYHGSGSNEPGFGANLGVTVKF